MIRYLHRLSSFFFYVLGASFFVAYIFLRNDIWPTPSALWLQAADLPFALCALLYGGSSLYLSLVPEGKKATVLGWVIALPLMVIFAVLVVLNFWGVV